MRSLILILLLSVFAAFSASCVKHVDCKGAISNAEQMIAKARAEGASDHANDYLELSLKEHERALAESQAGNKERAIGFAKRSESDAELAMLLARYRKYKTEKEELDQQLKD